MRKFLLIILLSVMSFGFVGCKNMDDSVIRIHIRANSNTNMDQEIKLLVKDRVVEFITPLIADCENSDQVKLSLNNSLLDIENIANRVLCENGFNYVSKAKINNEYFPTRMYGDKVFQADYYDALILELGSGNGDNWWCVAYPPLCFVGTENNSGSVRYRSKIIELVNKYFR